MSSTRIDAVGLIALPVIAFGLNWLLNRIIPEVAGAVTFMTAVAWSNYRFSRQARLAVVFAAIAIGLATAQFLPFEPRPLAALLLMALAASAGLLFLRRSQQNAEGPVTPAPGHQ